MKKIILVLVLVGSTASSWAANEINDKWVERGRIAEIKVEGLKKKLGVEKKASYEYLLEFAYSMQVDKVNRDLVHKKEAGIDFYKIMFRSSKKEAEKDPLFVINYVYDSKSGEFVGTKIEMLPKKWYLIQNSLTPGILILDLNDDGYVVLFNLNDPFKTTVAKL